MLAWRGKITHMPDNAAEIAKLEAILNAGASSVTVDGQSVTYDFDEIKARIAKLKREDTTNGYMARPRSLRINLGGF